MRQKHVSDGVYLLWLTLAIELVKLMMGLIFKSELDSRTWLYEVTSDKEARYSLKLTGVYKFRGNVAIEMSSPGRLPDTERIWKLEPIGYLEGTIRYGLVVRVPEFRF